MKNKKLLTSLRFLSDSFISNLATIVKRMHCWWGLKYIKTYLSPILTKIFLFNSVKKTINFERKILVDYINLTTWLTLDFIKSPSNERKKLTSAGFENKIFFCHSSDSSSLLSSIFAKLIKILVINRFFFFFALDNLFQVSPLMLLTLNIFGWQSFVVFV